MQLVCPAGSPPALKAAIDHGADAVYVGFRDQTNARAFPGLNFTEADLRSGIEYAHSRGRKVYVALNTYPSPAGLNAWHAVVDRAAALRVDAVICADMGVLNYAARRHPGLPRHLSVQGSATTHAALRYYCERFGIARAVLPRVLSIQQGIGNPNGGGLNRSVQHEHEVCWLECQNRVSLAVAGSAAERLC